MSLLNIEELSRCHFSERTAEIALDEYVQRPAFLMRSGSTGGRAETLQNIVAKVSPFEFVLRTPRPYFVHYDDHETAPPWTLFLITGQYGMGKTVFVQTLLKLVDRDPELSLNWCVVPVPLTSCRSKLGSKHIPAKLEDLVAAGGIPGLKAAQFGAKRLLLILDGLDELVDDLQSYNDFFESVRSFLNSKRSQGILADVLVSARIELILSVDGPDCTQLLGSFNRGPNRPSTVFSLALDFFDRSRVVAYFERNLNTTNVAEIIREVDRDDDLFATLRRPLLLKIFCELATHERRMQVSLTELARSPAALIDEYVSIANERGIEIQKSTAFKTKWDFDSLAMRALDLYKSAKPGFDRSDIIAICRLSEGSSNQDVFHSILKCPFLQRLNEDLAVFSHRLFLEFFVARGMANRAQNSDIKVAHEFNELVLNVDMRQILRFFINDREREPAVGDNTKFHELTKFSYGLLEESANDWSWPEPPLDEERRKELDGIRRKLLDAMTFPLQKQNESLSAVEKFFELEDNPPLSATQSANASPNLDPRYLMFCYESIATYLIYNRDRDQEHRTNKINFANRVSDRLSSLVERLESNAYDDKAVIRRNHLLLERLVSIARRLGIDRSSLEAGLVERMQHLVGASSWDKDSRSRLKPSLKEWN